MGKALYSALRSGLIALLGAVLMLGSAAPAQIQPVDPDKAIDGDLSKPSGAPAATPSPAPTIAAEPLPSETAPATLPTDQATVAANPAQPSTTYKEDDLIGAAEGVFGKGAKGLADVIKDLLKKQGEPNAYIVGREGGGAIGIGLRYGSGTLFHKVEGQRPVYWTGPSIGFDAGASAGSTFVLVYNLYNTEDLYHRFPAGEGQAYLVAGYNVSYVRRGNVVLIPIRSGVGLRLGVNAGYMKFSKKQRWFPF
ncbi:DUF1134 domain-containing protein [Novosphingobium sp.]|uniref:DUF1134 domain-containing protein n=1 Tax=Novosphingobium sp. TaxID=1874826 RepID=UPI0025F93105|nr:DUF1134 domain-containing protein [Novosphingobium sp.]MCC6924415.1 DUF1134 domain-containing protein [Novosphingobium sp.]